MSNKRSGYTIPEKLQTMDYAYGVPFGHVTMVVALTPGEASRRNAQLIIEGARERWIMIANLVG